MCFALGRLTCFYFAFVLITQELLQVNLTLSSYSPYVQLWTPQLWTLVQLWTVFCRRCVTSNCGRLEISEKYQRCALIFVFIIENII